MNLAALGDFIVRAKAQTYIAQSGNAAPSRLGAHDLRFSDGNWSYLDSYFGGTDFVGQETIWFDEAPAWSMCYYGRIIEPTLMDATIAGEIIVSALSEMYKEGRFLGGYRWVGEQGTYTDQSDGDFTSFEGREKIEVNGTIAYDLKYFGGLIKP